MRQPVQPPWFALSTIEDDPSVSTALMLKFRERWTTDLLRRGHPRRDPRDGALVEWLRGVIALIPEADQRFGFASVR